MHLDARFLKPPATCALCGRQVDPDGALVLETDGECAVAVSVHGCSMSITLTPAPLRVVCRECGSAHGLGLPQ